MPMSS